MPLDRAYAEEQLHGDRIVGQASCHQSKHLQLAWTQVVKQRGRCGSCRHTEEFAQLVEELIAPTLAAGGVVVSDRYLLANIVYQGSAGGLLEEEIALVGMVATGGLMPDLTIVLDIAPDTAHARVAERPTHLFPPSLVRSQFEALESPLGEPDVLRVDANESRRAQLGSVLTWLGRISMTTS